MQYFWVDWCVTQHHGNLWWRCVTLCASVCVGVTSALSPSLPWDQEPARQIVRVCMESARKVWRHRQMHRHRAGCSWASTGCFLCGKRTQWPDSGVPESTENAKLVLQTPTERGGDGWIQLHSLFILPGGLFALSCLSLDEVALFFCRREQWPCTRLRSRAAASCERLLARNVLFLESMWVLF